MSTLHLLKTSLRPHQTRVFRTGFRVTLRLRLFWNFCLREFLLSAFTNRFEWKCEPKRLMLLYYKICPCLLLGAKVENFIFICMPRILKKISLFVFVRRDLHVGPKPMGEPGGALPPPPPGDHFSEKFALSSEFL